MECFPTWQPGKPNASLSCLDCAREGKKCSFKEHSFGISKWPTVKRWVEPVVSRPNAENLQETETVDDKMMVENEVVREPTVREIRLALRNPPSTSTRAQTTSTVTNTPAATTPVLTTGPTHAIQAVPMAATPLPSMMVAGSTRRAQAKQITIWYTDLINFDAEASNPNLSLADVQYLRSEARAAMLREKNDADQVVAKMEDRRVIWEGIVERLSQRIEVRLSDEGRR